VQLSHLIDKRHQLCAVFVHTANVVVNLRVQRLLSFPHNGVFAMVEHDCLHRQRNKNPDRYREKMYEEISYRLNWSVRPVDIHAARSLQLALTETKGSRD
jgi:hypothetical protein